MKIISVMLAVFLSSVGVFAQPGQLAQPDQGNGTFTFDKKEGKRIAQVVFDVRPFDLVNHKSITVVREDTFVDGRLAYGTDISIPRRELASMKFYLDGKEIRVPRHLYTDCFEPQFDEDLFSLRFGKEPGSLIVTMHGSDGAGGYEVSWTLRKNGRHSRSIKKSEH